MRTIYDDWRITFLVVGEITTSSFCGGHNGGESISQRSSAQHNVNMFISNIKGMSGLEGDVTSR